MEVPLSAVSHLVDIASGCIEHFTLNRNLVYKYKKTAFSELIENLTSNSSLVKQLICSFSLFQNCLELFNCKMPDMESLNKLTKLTALTLTSKLTTLSLQTLVTALPALKALSVTLISTLEEEEYDFKWGAHMETLHIISSFKGLTFNIPKNLLHFSLDDNAILFTDVNTIVNLEDLFTEKLISCKMWTTTVGCLEKLSTCSNLKVIIKHIYFVFIFV